jgi:membrane-associated protease RseP (regulator of RpoE activity)
MTDTPMGGGHDPAEPTQPEHLEPPVAATRPTDMPPTPTTAVPTATAGAPPVHRRGVMVPVWVLAIVAALVMFGGGYLIGHAVGDDGGDGRSSARFVGPGAGPFGRGQMPDVPGFGNGPFGRNGNGGNGNGNGGGGDSPAVRSAAFLGVGVANAANGGGARITTVVASGPAADAGITRGDVITAIDGTEVTNVASLRSAIADHEPGDDVTVTYTRDGTKKSATATLGDRDATSQ